LPTQFSLSQNYPNPFKPSTTISLSVPSTSFITVKVYDALGREVATVLSDELSPGTHARQWNAEGLSSGVYFYRMIAHPFPVGGNARLSKRRNSFDEVMEEFP